MGAANKENQLKTFPLESMMGKRGRTDIWTNSKHQLRPHLGVPRDTGTPMSYCKYPNLGEHAAAVPEINHTFPRARLPGAEPRRFSQVRNRVSISSRNSQDHKEADDNVGASREKINTLGARLPSTIDAGASVTPGRICKPTLVVALSAKIPNFGIQELSLLNKLAPHEKKKKGRGAEKGEEGNSGRVADDRSRGGGGGGKQTMSKSSIVIAALILVLSTSSFVQARYKFEDNVLILTEAEFDHATRDFHRLLVLFPRKYLLIVADVIYTDAPWCGICRGFMKDYRKAATLLRHEGSDIVLATVNGHVEKSLTRRFKLPGFPVVKYYKNGLPHKYTGGRGAKNLVMWLKSQ
ncbi:unnamed protein product [Notodromas monacha]|uniref:Thioredoxin domain-containing protein n=1 Tax=Notodromas monacha TaxID=399045 RepID=A0A7R9GET6_9CRUS|nr:unnamed protein product [Notodromas monacha]CAG0918396.1 unnamed protein product [Notodromas monacha]